MDINRHGRAKLPTSTGVEMEYQVAVGNEIIRPDEVRKNVEEFMSERGIMQIHDFYSNGMKGYVDGFHYELGSKESPAKFLGHQVLAMESVILQANEQVYGYDADVKLPLSVSNGVKTRGFHLNIAIDNPVSFDDFPIRHLDSSMTDIVELMKPIFGTGRPANVVDKQARDGSFYLGSKNRHPGIYRHDHDTGTHRSANRVIEIRTLDYPISTFALKHMGNVFMALTMFNYAGLTPNMYNYMPSGYTDISDIGDAFHLEGRDSFLELVIDRADELELDQVAIESLAATRRLNEMLATDLNDEWLNQNHFGVFKYNKLKSVSEKYQSKHSRYFYNKGEAIEYLRNYSDAMDTLGGKYDIVGNYRRWGGIDESFLIEDVLAAGNGSLYTGYAAAENRCQFLRDFVKEYSRYCSEQEIYTGETQEMGFYRPIKTLRYQGVDKLIKFFEQEYFEIAHLDWRGVQLSARSKDLDIFYN